LPLPLPHCVDCVHPPDLEWKLTYVGSSHTDAHDQTLDTVLVGPIPLGTNRFTFAADPPDAARIPGAEVASVTVALLTCAYRGREFVRVGSVLLVLCVAVCCCVLLCVAELGLVCC
jgi:hypothetical protein